MKFVQRICFIVVLLFSYIAIADDRSVAKDLVDELMQECVKLVNDGLIQNKNVDHDYIIQIGDKLTQYFGIEMMSEFVAGRYWQVMNEDQKAELVVFYRLFLARSYLSMMSEYQNLDYVIRSVVPSSDGNRYMVQATMRGDSRVFNTEVQIRYIVIYSEKQRKWFVNDLIIDGVSILAGHRSDFTSILESQGIDGLLARSKNMK